MTEQQAPAQWPVYLCKEACKHGTAVKVDMFNAELRTIGNDSTHMCTHMFTNGIHIQTQSGTFAFVPETQCLQGGHGGCL